MRDFPNSFTGGCRQRGSMLLESLIGLLIFSVGVIAFIGMQATAVRDTADAKYRADASFLANQIIGRMWSDRPNLAAYAHRPSGAVCAPTGANSVNPNVANWLSSVNGLLPGALAATQQITIGANNLVTVGLCWRVGDTPPHNLVVTAQIQG
ncbi:MAG: type IV pilus modification protein PilV [Betaproteobacteria bacterium]